MGLEPNFLYILFNSGENLSKTDNDLERKYKSKNVYKNINIPSEKSSILIICHLLFRR